MSATKTKLKGSDLAKGVALAEIADGAMLLADGALQTIVILAGTIYLASSIAPA